MEERVLVFAPSPLLTVTVENRGDEPDLHLHAGGQGIWQARTIASLGVPVVLCAALGGETGQVVRHLVEGDGLELIEERVGARNGAYVHDRRSEQREPVVEIPGDPLSRHELDALYETTLLEGLRSRTVVLSGPSHGRTVPTSAYRRLAADLGANGCRVIADLAGERLDAVLSGGADFVKISHEELLADGRAASAEAADLLPALYRLRERGAASVVVSRAARPALALLDDTPYEVLGPSLHPVEPRGAGDSMTAAVAAALTRGEQLTDAVRFGAAAGALNVTRHGLGTSGGDGVRRVAELVELRPLEGTT